MSVDKIYSLSFFSLPKVLEIHWITISKEAWKIDYERERAINLNLVCTKIYSRYFTKLFYRTTKKKCSNKEGKFCRKHRMNFKIPFQACNDKHFLKIAFQLVKKQKIIFQLKAFKTLYFFSNSCSNLKKWTCWEKSYEEIIKINRVECWPNFYPMFF